MQATWNELQKALLSIEILFGKIFLSFKIKLFNSSAYPISTPPFNLTPFTSLINFKGFLSSLNGESGRAYLDS